LSPPGTQAAAALVFLCGAAHAPRYWAGLSHGLLGATLVASALCMLLGLALPARAAQARLAAAASALVVTTVLGAGQVLGGRFGLPDPARLWAATLAPPWLAGAAAAAAALAALGVVLAVLLGTGDRDRGGS
ncbi:insulinase family protein, partial [Streptomyces misionensis]